MTRCRYTVDITIDKDEQTTTAAIHIGAGPAKLARFDTASQTANAMALFQARIGREIVKHAFRLLRAEAEAAAPEDARLLPDGFTVGEHREGKCGGSSVCPYCEAQEDAQREYDETNPDLEAEAEAAGRTAPAYVPGRGEE